MQLDPSVKLQALLNIGREIYITSLQSAERYQKGETFTPKQAVEKANELLDAAVFAAAPSNILQFPSQPGIV